MRSALIYAFYRDRLLDETPPAGEHWLCPVMDCACVSDHGDPLHIVPNLYRICDHRPVRISLESRYVGFTARMVILWPKINSVWFFRTFP